ncbi:hypothetical protein BH10BAC3_BH10BAC3_43060 [soil metagenome]
MDGLPYAGDLAATYNGKAVKQIGREKKYKAPEEDANFESGDYRLSVIKNVTQFVRPFYWRQDSMVAFMFQQQGFKNDI